MPTQKPEDRSFEQLANSLPQIIWTADPEGSLDYYNERWYQFTGAKRGETGDLSWTNYLHPDDIEKTTTNWYRSVKTGEDFKTELRFLNPKTNKYVWFLGTARASKNDQGEIIKWYGSCTEIDQLKKAEQQVVDILEGMNDSFFSIDADWNLSRVNSQMVKTTKINREEAVGKNFFLSFPMEKDSKYWINHHKIMEERVPVKYEEYYAPVDLWTEARGYPTADGGLAYLFRDISVEKRAQIKLEELTSKLQEAVRVRDEFLSIASHELLTPITSLKLQMQTLKRTVDPKEEKLMRLVDSSNLQITRLTKLIAGLLDVTRMDSGKMTYEFKDTDISKLVTDVVRSFTEDFLRTNNRIKLTAQNDLHIECDSLRIEQVLVNLLSNALKYGNDQEVNVVLKKTEKGIALTVQDKGIGVPADKLERVFERFERLAPSNHISGMGLGLYIAKQIVESHHGEIKIESELNKGSAFTVLLPKRI